MFKRFLSTKSPIDISTLSNGVRVVTDSTPGHFSAVGAYIDAGSRFEDPQKPGISHIVDRLSWRSTSKFSSTEMMNNLSNLGGNYMCSAQRESMIYQASVFNHDVEKMFECIASTITEPNFTDQEFEETLQGIEFEIGEMVHKPDVMLPELLHQVAYKNTLGLPLFLPQERLQTVQKSEVIDYHKKFYQPQNTVISMIGVDHDKAVSMTEILFGHLKNSAGKIAHEKPLYKGGEISIPFQPPLFSNLPELYHIQIAYETAGLLTDELYILAVLQKLLGGGSSFSAGGPGKGMFSRLYTRVLNQYGFIENCTSFNHQYVGSGLFGINVSATPQAAQAMPQVIAFEFSSMLESNAITQSEFDRAKNQLISSLLYNVESKLASLEDLGRQVQCQNKLISINEMIEKINAVQIKDLVEVVRKLVNSTPSIVMQGDRESFGDLNYVFNHFGLKSY